MIRPRDARGGFTLIETLVALAVLSVVALASMRGLVAVRLGLDRAQSTIAAEAVARSIVETELGQLAAQPGVTNGVTDGLEWSVKAEPLDLPDAPPPNPNRPRPPGAEAAAGPDATPPAVWRLLRVTVSVANGRGRPLSIETVRLAKAS